MNIIVIGLGSMGKRRIRLLKKYNASFSIYGIDAKKERCEQSQELYDITTSYDLSESLSKTKFDCAFIATSPLSHAKIIKQLLEYGTHIFTELNLTLDGYRENISLAKQKNQQLFLSSTFLYRKEIQEIKNLVNNCQKKSSYKYHSGQYLPDWHPWEKIEDYFVSNIKTNGCREIMAIELPWLVDVFGRIKTVQAIKHKISDLNIEYPDTYHIIIEHETGAIGSFSVDVVSRKPVRKLEVYNEELFLEWNGQPDGLFQYNFHSKEMENIKVYNQTEHLDAYSSTIIEDAYLEEIKEFFEVIDENTQPRYSFDKDYEILQLIDKIEQM